MKPRRNENAPIPPNAIHSVRGFIQFTSQGALEQEPPYFSPGGYGVPVIVDGKPLEFRFDFIEYTYDANRHDNGVVTVDVHVRGLDTGYINEQGVDVTAPNCIVFFRAICTTEMEEIHYSWDDEHTDGTIDENREDYFDVTQFQLEILHTEDGEVKTETIDIPAPLLASYNQKAMKNHELGV